MDKKFDFSVIMAVYNAEKYLGEAIDSVIAQDYGFDKIQLILVEDGSPDGSGAICDEYAAKYPDNIIAIHKENGGVSSARNAGLDAAEGTYVNFLDSDDKLSVNTMRRVKEMFDSAEGSTDIVTIPIFFFGEMGGEHPLNSKFNGGNRVVDLEVNWEAALLSSSCSFFFREAIGELRFDTKLRFAEDAKLIHQILLKKRKLGLVKNSKYFYRKHGSEVASAIDTSAKSPDWYLPYLEHFQYATVQNAINTLGYVPRYIQYTLMYDLQWRFLKPDLPRDLLTEDEIQIYLDKLYGMLDYIDEVVIVKQKSIGLYVKSYLCYKKNHQFPRQVLIGSDVYHLYGSMASICAYAKYPIRICFIRMEQDKIIVEGTIPHYHYISKEKEAPFVMAGGKRFEITYTGYVKPYCVLEEQTGGEYGFSVEIPLEENLGITFWSNTAYRVVQMTNLQFAKYAPVSTLSGSYFAQNGWVLTAGKGRLYVQKSANVFRQYELPFLNKLLKSKRAGAKKAFAARVVYHLLKPFLGKKNYWLISDKANRADDNGEAFFKYICQLKPKDITPVFLISKDSPDFDRLKQYGKVVPYMSWTHKFLYLFAQYSISAYAHDEINNPFLGHHDPFRDLLQKCQYVFLQHGITKDDVSSGTNRFHKNMVGFVTSVWPEYRSIVDSYASYGYSEDKVWLTGFPRYDYLYHDERKSIVIMPTWRRDHFGTYHAEKSQWDLKPGFKETEYYKFYNGLVNDAAFLEKAEQLGYKIVFVPHPVLFPYIDQFEVDPRVEIKGTDVVYRDMFAQNKLLLTDFSSVAFDFAYLRKPVVYAHFDTNHYAEGYFDYERDGMGEVEYNLQDTMNRIIEYMENDCQLKDIYRQRIDNFFAFNDRSNSERIYQKLREMNQ